MNITELKNKAVEIRKSALTMVNKSGQGHIGGSLSSVDYLTVLFYNRMNLDPQNPDWELRDRFILSKGHCCEGYYAILADLGFFPKKELDTFCMPGTRLLGHPDRNLPGIEMNSGSLGHGLSCGCGMALCYKKEDKPNKVYVLLGDGEFAEGSNWEAMMFASNYSLDNLYVALDRNHFQISGNTEDIMKLEPVKQRVESFGFACVEINGNSIEEITNGLNELDKIKDKPKMLILNTIKGKGVDFMEGNYKWHHGSLSDDELANALASVEKED